MRPTYRFPLAVLLIGLPAAAGSQAAAPLRPFGTLREQADTQQRWLASRMNTVLPAIMRKYAVDMWVIPMREYNEDPVFTSIVSPTTFAARRRTIYVFSMRGDSVERIALGGSSQGGVYTAVRSTQAAAGPAGGRAERCVGDLGSAVTLDALVETAGGLGGIDILVNNGALTATFGPVLEVSDDRVDEILGVNLRSAVLLSLRAARVMAAKKRGSIVNLTSVGGSQRAHHDNAIYDVTKGGLDALTRALAVDLGPAGIRVNAVGPAATTDAPAPGRAQDTPLRRGGVPADVAAAVLYLVSDDAAFVTGQILYVDGGLSAQLRSPAGAASSQEEVPRG